MNPGIKYVLAALVLAASTAAQGAVIMLNLDTLTESVMVGLNDANPLVAPVAPGNGWYSGAYAGTIRQRQSGSSVELRTQWNFRFGATALTAINPANLTILSATLNIPQIGRLNNQNLPGNPFYLYANAYDWSDDGSVDYPTWNRGRTDSGGDGFTVATNFGGANTFGLATDTANTNVEGSFVIDSATYGGLLTAIQNWSANPASNNGFLFTYQAAQFGGIAFGTPTLLITANVVPEPSTLLLSILCFTTLGIVGASRARRVRQGQPVAG